MLNHTNNKINLAATLFAVLLVFTAMTGQAAAADGGIICSGGEESSAETILSYVLGLFMIMGFALGIFMYAASQFEITVFTSSEPLGGIDGKGAIKNAILIPFIIYFFDLISKPLFGVDISCIVPGF